MRLLDDARICLMTFTKLPVTWPEDLPRDRITRALQAAPVVGLASGLIGALVYAVAFWAFNGSVHICATLAVLTQTLLGRDFATLTATTYAASDTPDQNGLALGSGATLGPVMGLALILKVFLVAEIAVVWQAGLALIISGALSQLALVQILAWSKPEITTSITGGNTAPTKGEASTALVFGAVFAGLASAAAFQLGLIAPSLGAFVGAGLGGGLMALASQRLKGVSTAGSIGASVMTAELGALLGLVAFLPSMGF